jgi:hypothetical protein
VGAAYLGMNDLADERERRTPTDRLTERELLNGSILVPAACRAAGWAPKVRASDAGLIVVGLSPPVCSDCVGRRRSGTRSRRTLLSGQ